MRHERQPKDRLILTLEVVLAGVGKAGILPAFTGFQLQRLSDSAWWRDSAGTWGVAPDPSNQLSEVDATNFPGLYQYVVDPAELDADLAAEGYRFVVVETAFGSREHGLIDVDEVAGGGVRDNLLTRTAALRQRNMRFAPSTWDPVTKQPTAGTITIYGSKADATADINAIGQYTIQATFDGSGQLTEYTSVEDS